ncbi:autotransporter family protein [Pandoraea sputorum]|uniref:Extracellular serine protease n=1 Tax=Pandoraea sputorum TaxID=93222 RepID=A0A5E5B4P1_9BURK|nr:autotransporter outer membrane beta-barrel domain-containing protein [Pandoraea sputorum]VVE80142.1 Extracellular serine protease [Pandoraea sputorum]
MQKNHPKSNVLRQTKICMAAAAVAAAVLPAYVQAQAVPQRLAQWEISRNDRISEIANAIGDLKNNLDKARATSRFADKVDIQLAWVKTVIADAAGNEDREESFKYLASAIADDLKIEDSRLTDAGRKQKLALSALKEKLDEASAAAKGGRQDDIDRAQKALETEVAKHARFLTDSEQAFDALKREARLLRTKRDRVQGVTSEAELNGLSNTRRLRAATSNVPTLGGALTWSDKHLTNFMEADATTDTHNALGNDSILEFTRGSGEESDAIAGTSGVRDVGTLHSRVSADHNVRVDGGTLNVHRGIEGKGRLGISVGKGGTLHFVDDGIGVASDARDVTLWAGRSEKASPDGGTIEFGKRTSAGTATIILHRGGNLHFAEGANAGVSDIDIAQGASATFHAANAAVASIQNDGTLTLEAGSKAGRADILNQSGAHAMFRNADLQRAELVNLGSMHLERTKGGSATLINGVDAHVDVLDSDLQQLGLANVGVVNVRGNTLADGARIEMLGGRLNISDIEMQAPGRKAEKTLSIGSLSGIGRVVTGDTKLVLGGRDEDDRFDGEIVREEVSSGSASNALRRASRSSTQVAAATGSNVVKAGTGNLTLGGDQSGVASLRIDGGSVTAAHAKALGAGTVTVTDKGAVKLASDVDGVNHIDNAGRIDLGTNKLAVQKYTSKAGAKISSHVSRLGDGVAGGAIQVSEDSDFTNTAIDVTVANDITLAEVQDKLGVVSVAEGKTASLGKVTVGSIVGGKTEDPTDPTTTTDPTGTTGTTDPIGPSDPSGVITSQNVVQYLATDGNYSANERAVLASVDGVTVGDLTSGGIGGRVLSEMALQTAGSDEQRRSASLLSGESLVNNALAAQGATTAFQRGMQSRMLAGGAMFDDKTANGASADNHGIAGWASFSGGNTSQRGDALSFDVRGIDGAIGVDKRISSSTIVGASVGMGNQNSKAKGIPGESKINSVSLGLYGSHLNDANVFVGGGVSYTNHSVTTDRTVAARNASARLSGKTSGNTFGAFGEIGKRFDVAGFHVDPSIGLRLASTRLNAFDETNRGGASGNDGLKVGAQSQTSARSVLGVRFSRDVITFDGGKVTPMMRLAYEHEFGNTQSSLTNSIYGAPRAFNVKGAKLGRDVFTADLGVDLQLKKRFNLHVGGNVSVRQGESALGGGISAKYRF